MCWIVIFSVMRGINRKYTGSQEVRNSAQDYTPPLMAHKLLCLTNCWLTPPSQTPTHTCQYIWHAPPGKHMQFPTLTLNRTVWAVAGANLLSHYVYLIIYKNIHITHTSRTTEMKTNQSQHCTANRRRQRVVDIWGYGAMEGATWRMY